MVLAFCGGYRTRQSGSLTPTTSIPLGVRPRNFERTNRPRTSHRAHRRTCTCTRTQRSGTRTRFGRPARANCSHSTVVAAAHRVRVGHADSSTSTGLRPEYEYDWDQRIECQNHLSIRGSPRSDLASDAGDPCWIDFTAQVTRAINAPRRDWLALQILAGFCWTTARDGVQENTSLKSGPIPRARYVFGAISAANSRDIACQGRAGMVSQARPAVAAHRRLLSVTASQT